MRTTSGGNICNELNFIPHQNIMCITDNPCHGELTPGSYTWKNGFLVDREWACDVCGQYLKEKELLSRIDIIATDEY